MRFKMIMILATFLVFLLALSAVSAEDNATDDIVGAADEDVGLDENDVLKDVSTEEQSSPKSFTDLLNYINSEIDKGHNKIELKDDYIYNDGDPIIDFYESITLYGSGVTIDANHSVPIFGVFYDGVTFEGLTLMNGISAMDGAAIFSNSFYTAKNCTFINNRAASGGALFGNGMAVDCTFINNNAALDGGAMNGGSATNCTFIGNIAGKNGGAVANVNVDGCNFSKNSANASGGALFKGSASSCIFNNNHAADGGAVNLTSSEYKVTDSIFFNNTADKNGGAMVSSVAENCRFIYNMADNAGALYQSNASKSTFMLNRAVSTNPDIDNATLDDCDFPSVSLNVTDYFRTWAKSGEKLFLNLTYGDGETLNDINVSITVYGPDGIANYSCLTGQNWTVNMFPGKYTAVLDVEYANFNSTNVTLNIVTPTVISLNNPINQYNGDTTLDIALLDWYGQQVNGRRKLNVSITDSQEHYTDDSGKLSVPLKDMLPNYYTAKVSFEGDDDYNASNASCEITIIIAEPLIDAEDLTTTVGVRDIFYIHLMDNRGYSLSGRTITIDLNGSVFQDRTQPDGIVEIFTNILGVGNYTVKISYDGSDLFRRVSKVAHIIVNKISTNLNASDVNTTVGSDDYLIVGLKDNKGSPIANVNVTVDLNGIKNYTTNDSGQINISTKDLPAKTYVAKVNFNGTDVYEQSSILVNVTVNKFSTDLIADDLNTSFGKDDYLIVGLKDNKGSPIANATLSVELNGLDNYTTNATGQIKISTKDLNATTYYANVTFPGDETHSQSKKKVKITVDKVDSTLKVTDIEFDYNSTGSANVSFVGAVGVNATLINQSEAIVKVCDDVIEVSALDVGNYTLLVTTIPDDNHNAVSMTANVTVRKVDSSLTLSDVVVDYGGVCELIVPIWGATGIFAKIDGINAKLRDNAVIISDLDVGNYTLAVTTIPDGNHNAVTMKSNIAVIKVNSSVTIHDVVCDYGSVNHVFVHFQGATGVTAKIDDVNASVRDNAVIISDLDAGTYKLSVTTVPDANHYAVSEAVNVTVNKIDTFLVADNITTTFNVNKDIVISLKDSHNRSMSGIKVEVNLNGVKNYTTDGYGQIKLSTKGLVPKDYTAIIRFDGNNNFNGASATSKVVIGKAAPKLSAKSKSLKLKDKSKKYSIVLKTNQNKAMAKSKVYIKVNNKIYSAVVGKNGVATFKLTKLTKKGKYRAIVFYKGNSYYSAKSVKVKIVVK